jgi:hypothetical protein
MAKFGWYSKQQSIIVGTFQYQLSDGTKVIVSEITDSRYNSSAWPDMIYKGEVTKFCGRLTGAVNEFDAAVLRNR